MLNKLETHVWRWHCRKQHMDSSLYPWKTARPGSGFCRQGAANDPPLQIFWPLGNGQLHLKSAASGSPSTSSDWCSVLPFKALQREMEWGSTIMLSAFDRGTESDYRSTILHITLDPVSEKILPRLSLNAQIILFQLVGSKSVAFLEQKKKSKQVSLC